MTLQDFGISNELFSALRIFIQPVSARVIIQAVLLLFLFQFSFSECLAKC